MGKKYPFAAISFILIGIAIAIFVMTSFIWGPMFDVAVSDAVVSDNKIPIWIFFICIFSLCGFLSYLLAERNTWGE
jgi:hypothetical protein